MNPNQKQYTFDLLNAEGLVVYRNGIDWQGKFERSTGNIVWLNAARKKPEIWLFTVNPTATTAQILEYDPLLGDCTYLETIYKKDVDGTSLFHKHLFDRLETLADAKDYRMSDMSDMDEGNGDYSVILNINEDHEGEQFNIADPKDLARLEKWLRPNPVFLGREFRSDFEWKVTNPGWLEDLDLGPYSYLWFNDDQSIVCIYRHAEESKEGKAYMCEMDYNKPKDSLQNPSFEVWHLTQDNHSE